MKYKYLMVAALGTMGMWGMTSRSLAMDMHVNGNQVFLSGGVVQSDGYMLADYISRLRVQGRVIDTRLCATQMAVRSRVVMPSAIWRGEKVLRQFFLATAFRPAR